MNFVGVVGLAVATGFAVTNWAAVSRGLKHVEYVAKPATLVALIFVAVTLDPADGAVRAWFVVALAFSLAGDVFLMLPRDMFVAGLAAFLVGHVAYVAGFLAGGVSSVRVLLGAVVVLPVTGGLGRRILRALRDSGQRELGPPVALYMAAITAMVILAFDRPLAAAGALSFYGSDALIAWNRFVRPYPWAPVAIMVTYHLGQAALVGSLV